MAPTRSFEANAQALGAAGGIATIQPRGNQMVVSRSPTEHFFCAIIATAVRKDNTNKDISQARQ